MHQIYLTGRYASALAEQLFTALNIRPVGCRLLPFSIAGDVRGEALYLLLPPAEPLLNNIPCRLRLENAVWTIIPHVVENVAVPSLMSAAQVHAPILLDGLTGDLLDMPSFRDAVCTCLNGPHPVITVARDYAAEYLTAMTPADQQLWFAVPDDPEDRAALLEQLITETALRF